MLKYIDSFWILISFTVFFMDCSHEQKLISLKEGLIIKKSGLVKEQIYQITPREIDKGIILIEGDNIEIDFNGALLNGASEGTLPDQFSGIGLEIRNGKNITLKNLALNS